MKLNSMWTIFRYRLRRYRGQVLGWGIALAVYGLLMVPFYNTILEQQGQFEELIDAYPEEIAAFVGGMEDIFSPTGYLDTYIFSLMPLILGVFAVLMGSGLVAADEESFAAGEGHVGFFEVDLAIPDGLDLGSQQLDAGNLLLENVVDMASLSIGREDPAAIAHCTTMARTSTICGSNWFPLPRSMISKARSGLTVGRYLPGTVRTS